MNRQAPPLSRDVIAFECLPHNGRRATAGLSRAFMGVVLRRHRQRFAGFGFLFREDIAQSRFILRRETLKANR